LGFCRNNVCALSSGDRHQTRQLLSDFAANDTENQRLQLGRNRNGSFLKYLPKIGRAE
jgi:hypothetical protein